jgi:carotenoid cleavage dioxygenase
MVTRRDFLAATLATGCSTCALPLAKAAAAQANGAENMSAWSSDSPFLSRAFAPVFDERDDADLPVQGRIPEALLGVFMRNGPNPQFKPDERYAYPFDGTGMVHAVYLADGRARYRNRWVLTKELAEERAAGHRIYNSSFSPPPHANLANTNIVHHGGRFLALYEGGVPYEVDREINTVGRFDYEGKLPRVMSAHPKIDPVTGELLSVEYDLMQGGLVYTRADKTGQLDRIVPFDAPWRAMVHDIAITERHVVVFLCPLVFDFTGKGPPAAWEPDRGTMVALIPRDTRTAADITWIKAAPFFNWHTVNAFEEGSRLEVVLPWYENYSLTAPAKKLELHRLVVHTDTGVVEDIALDDRPCEFGRINDAYLGRRARYGYVGMRMPRPGEKPQSGAFEALARYDLQTGSKDVHQFPPGVTVCEPVFVADPHGKGEEDGYILTFAHAEGSDGGTFLILDARNLAGEAVAAIQLPRRVPAGLHGSWTPA